MKRADLILAGVVLAIALGLFGYRFITREEGAYCLVSIDGKLTARYPLNQDLTVTLEGDGGNNILVIRDGKASITEADCPDKLCVNQADICHRGETIVCLPHKLVISIEGGDEQDVDAKAG